MIATINNTETITISTTHHTAQLATCCSAKIHIVGRLRGVRLHFGETETPFCRGVTMTPRNVPGGSRATSPPWVTQGDALKVCR